MSKYLSRVVSAVAILAALAGGVPASAQSDDILTASRTGTAGSPLGLTRCKIARIGNFWNRGTFDVGNRTKHQMLSAKIALRYYDADNALIGQAMFDLPMQTPLTSGDTGAYTADWALSLTEGGQAVSRIACRPAAATFSGNKHWTYGQKWTDKLLPLNTESAGANGEQSRGSTAVSSAVPHVQIGVSNAWNDTVNGVTFVHDTLTIFGGDAPATLQPGNFMLQMALANGTKKSYTALAQAAPTYQKLNPLTSQVNTAYEVDPATDLGRLGTITVPARGSATITVTFAVQDPVLNASDNRAVSLR